ERLHPEFHRGSPPAPQLNHNTLYHNLSEAEVIILGNVAAPVLSSVAPGDAVSKRHLRPACNCLEFLADLRRPCGVQLVDLGILELQVKPHPVIRIPAEVCAKDLLISTKDASGYTLRYAGSDIAVQVHDAPAGSQFPGSSASFEAIWADCERIIDLRSGPRSSARIVAYGLPGQDPACFDITTIEIETRGGLARQLGSSFANMKIPPLKQQIAPIDSPLTAINIDIRNRQVPGADKPVHVDPQLGAVLQVEDLSAYSRCAAGVDVRVEHVLTRSIQLDVPIFVIIRTPGQPSHCAELLTVGQAGALG